MTATAVHGGGTRFIDYRGVVLADGKQIATVTDAITTVSMDYRVGAVAEMQVGLVDADGSLIERGLLQAGTTLYYFGETFQVAATDLDYRGEAILAVYSARSRLARRLRNTMGPKTTKGQTPAQWITRKVKDAGGTAVVEAGAKRLAIHQKRGESVLDVIANLAADTGTEWTEFADTVYCGTGWWAYQGRTGLPTWPVSFDRTARTDVTQLSTRSSVDDRLEAASASLSVPFSVGSEWRPWHRVELSGVSKNDRGTWLIQDVSFDLHDSSTVDATLYRPLKSSPKNGSSSTSQTGTGTTPDGLTPDDNSSYTDAARPAGWSGRTVARILSLYKANPGGLNHTILNGCLWYAQEAAGYPHIGANPHALWVMLPTAKRHANRHVVPGAVLMYRTSRVGHATVYLGGGMVLGTDMDTSGNYSPGKWSIAPADACERSFGTLLGWYEP